jgi:hypothetical protein
MEMANYSSDELLLRLHGILGNYSAAQLLRLQREIERLLKTK